MELKNDSRIAFEMGLTAVLSVQVNNKIPSHSLPEEELKEFDYDVSSINRLLLRGLIGERESMLARQRVLVLLGNTLNKSKNRNSHGETRTGTPSI